MSSKAELLAELEGASRKEALGILKSAPAELKDDKEFALAALKAVGDYTGGKNLSHVSAALRADREVVFAAMEAAGQWAGEAFGHASEALRADPEVLRAELLAKLEGADAPTAYHSFQGASEELRADREVALAAIAGNPNALQFASGALKNDRELVLAAKGFDNTDREAVLAAVAQHGDALEYASEALKEDKELVLAAVAKNCRALVHASEALKADPEVFQAAKAALLAKLEQVEGMKAYDAFEGAPEELRGDKEVVLKAIERARAWAHMFLGYGASEALKADKEVVLAAVAQNCDALKHVSQALKADKEVVLAAVTQNGRALEHTSEALKADKKVVLAAVAQDCKALQHASEALKADKEFVLGAIAAVDSSKVSAVLGWALEADKEVVLAAVAKDGGALQHASEALASDKEMVLAAVAKNSSAAKHINWTEALLSDREVVLAAKGFDNTDRKAVLAAVTKDGDALRHASEALLTDREVVLKAKGFDNTDREAVLAAVAKSWKALRFASAELQADAELLGIAKAAALMAMAENAHALQDAPETLKGMTIRARAMPEAAITVQSQTLAAPGRPPAAEKNDIDSYNAKMLGVMQEAFNEVEQLTDGMVDVTPAGASWEGSPGSVFKAKIEEQPCIVKVFKSSEITPLWRLVREVYVQACCSAPPHDNVCRLLGWGSPDSADGSLTGLKDDVVVYMVLEDAGDEIDTTYSPEESLRCFKQIVSGVHHAHGRGFYHRDLKVENVARSKMGAVKLIRLGRSSGVGTGGTAAAVAPSDDEILAREQWRMRLVNKVFTRAPEVVLGEQLKGTPESMEKLDVWGLGVILFGMVFGYAPFGEEAQDADAFDQSANQIYKLSWGENCPDGQYPPQSSVPEEVKKAYANRGTDETYDRLKRLADGMLAAEASERWTLEQVMKELKIHIAQPLNAWLQQTVTHDVSGKPQEIGYLTGDFLEVISTALGPEGKPLGQDVDVSELSRLLPADALQKALDDSGKKGPILKKLFARLHYELEYPLNEKQAKKIKVTPHKPQPTAEEGVPDLSAEPEPEPEPEQ